MYENLFSFLFKLLDENIRNYTSNYNRLHKQLNDLRQYSSSDGKRLLNEQQTSIETRWNQLNRLITDKVRRNLIKYNSLYKKKRNKKKKVT